MAGEELYDPPWDPTDGPVSSVASTVSTNPNGYGAWPLTGTCAAQMRKQGVTGAALTLDEPYHGGYAYMAAMINYLIAQFVRQPTAAFSSGSLLADHGTPVPNTLCANTTRLSGVFSGSLCQGVEGFVKPMPFDTYHDTACNWKGQLVRPFLIRAPQPEACASSPSSRPQSSRI